MTYKSKKSKAHKKKKQQQQEAAPATIEDSGAVANVEWLDFATPHAVLSEDVRGVIDSVIESADQSEAQQHLVVHIRKGVEQIESFLRQSHSDAEGNAFVSFEAMVALDSDKWKQYVHRAETDRDMGVQHRTMQRETLRLNMRGMDLKVGRPGRPDDAVYQKSEYARKYMPRGNFLVEWTSPTTGAQLYFPLIRAYRKFTGQEDDAEEQGAVGQEVLSKFFTKPMSQAKYVISTTKENGEAAHLAVVKRSDGQYLYVLGSKNTHLVAESLEDVENACAVGGGSPYKAAAPIARGILKTLNGLPDEKRRFLCEFLAQTRLTASFEMLCPGYQHVQLLDYLEEDTPVFYGLSFPSWDAVPGAEICVNPVLAYELMRWVGIRTVQYKVVPFTPDVVAATLHEIRTAYQHEGAVNLFVDEDACVIGMEKFKTVWYVCLRAIREKAKSFLNRALPKKQPADGQSLESLAATQLQESIKSLRKRFKAIQVYLDLTEEVCQSYLLLGESFVTYLHDERLVRESDMSKKQQLKEFVATMFPVAWKEFLEHTRLEDRVLC